MCLDCQKLQKVFVIIEPKYSNSIFFEHINAQSNDSEVQKMIKDYSVTVVPTMIFINKNGQFIEKTEGYVPQDKLEQKIKALIGNG